MPPMAADGSIVSARSRASHRSPTRGRTSPTPSAASYRGDYEGIGEINGYNMGGQGLAGTWAKSESGVAETFISMWLSSLILHVHPKKQPRAIGFLIARHVRAIAHKVLKALADNATEEIIGRQLDNKAINHWIAHICTKSLVLWRHKAIALRVARMRLRTTVSRWLREELSIIFAAWSDLVTETRHLVVAFDRIENKKMRSNTKTIFQDWSDHMDIQDNKRNVLTRIVLRIQDRTMIKVMHLWFQMAGSLAIINHLAERGLQKYRANRLAQCLGNWQDTRIRGLKILQKMDSADNRWQRTLTEHFFGLWFSNSRHTAICAHRGLLLMAKDHARIQREAFAEWNESATIQKRHSMVFVILSWRNARHRMREAHEAWHQRVLALRCRFALLRRGLAHWCVIRQRETLRHWHEHAFNCRRLRLVLKRMRFKNLRLSALGALETWREQTDLSLKLMALNSRVLFMTDRRLLQQCLRSWQNEASNMSYVRSATIGGMSLGTFFGAQSKLKSFRAWFNHARENHRQESAIVRTYNRMQLRASYHQWNEHAIAWKRKTEKFSRMIFAFEIQVTKTAWHGWVHVHAKTVIRANKLMNLMWKWDRSKTLRSWQDWLAWIRHRAQVTKLFEKNVTFYLRRLVSNIVYEWACSAFRSALLKRSGKRFAILTILRNAGSILKAWHKATQEALTLSRSMHKLSCRVGLVVEADHFGAWRDVMDDTSYKALIISRQDAKLAIWHVHQHFEAWFELAQQVKEELQKHSRALVHAEHKTKLKFHDNWLSHGRLQARLRNLNQRVLNSADYRLADDAFDAWLGAQLSARASAAHELAISNKVRSRLLLDSFIIWFNEKVRLKKLRSGLSRLIESLEDRLVANHFEEWVFSRNFTARNLRLEQQYVSRYSLEVVGGFFHGWKQRARLQVQQAQGVERLVMRVDCRLLEYIFDRWNVNVHNEVMYNKHCMRVLTRSVLFVARKVFNDWAYQAETSKIFVERCERMLQARDVVAAGNVLYYWHRESFQNVRRFEGLERCMMRWQNKEMRAAIDCWWETITHEREIKKNIMFACRGREWRNMRIVFDAMKQQHRIGRQVRVLEATKQRELEAAAADVWVDTYYDMDYKRKNIHRLMRRYDLRAQASAFQGWLEELAYLRGAYGRAQLVQSRNISARATAAVMQLIQNAKARKRHRRLRISFYHRWYVVCLKNFFESWRSWHGKKMAVKGVLDQVVDMM